MVLPFIAGVVGAGFLGDRALKARIRQSGQEARGVVTHMGNTTDRLLVRFRDIGGEMVDATIEKVTDGFQVMAENLTQHAQVILETAEEKVRLASASGIEGVQQILRVDVPLSARLGGTGLVLGLRDGVALALGGIPGIQVAETVNNYMRSPDKTPRDIIDLLVRQGQGSQDQILDCYFMAFDFYGKSTLDAATAFLWQFWILVAAKMHAPPDNRGFLRQAVFRRNAWQRFRDNMNRHKLTDRALAIVEVLPESTGAVPEELQEQLADTLYEALALQQASRPALPAVPAPEPAPTMIVTPFDAAPVQEGQYYRIAAKCGKVLDVMGNRLDNSTHVQPWEEHRDARNQCFSFQKQTDGYWFIIARHSGKAMDVTNRETAPGTAIIQYTKAPRHERDHQAFGIVPKPNGFFSIRARHSGLVLEIKDASTVNGAVLQQAEEDGGDNQLFSFERVAGHPPNGLPETKWVDRQDGNYHFADNDSGCRASEDLEYYTYDDPHWLMLGHAHNKKSFLVVSAADHPSVRIATGWKRIWDDRGGRGNRDFGMFIPQCDDNHFKAVGVVWQKGANYSRQEPSRQLAGRMAVLHEDILRTATLGEHVWREARRCRGRYYKLFFSRLTCCKRSRREAMGF
ncbi:Beta-agarase AgaB34 [Symbiodinium microadriaticum]|uniref:Beta-agarase AgaB34 n=1 Tax=Symbiodinium microadriaticum TaxID=2951 RepID=A0A1Q9DS05_SYMMI|nr:Beta-agarase AgaB34 [Symbiodinium microadriaticum]